MTLHGEGKANNRRRLGQSADHWFVSVDRMSINDPYQGQSVEQWSYQGQIVINDPC